jgi:hypothetical protein
MQLARAIAVIFLGFFASWSLQGCGGKDKDDKPQALFKMFSITTHPLVFPCFPSWPKRFDPLKHWVPWIMADDWSCLGAETG